MAKKITVFLILSVSLGQVIRIPLGDMVAITPLDILAFFLAPFWIGKRKPLNKINLSILIFITVAFFSLLVNSRNLAPEQFLASFLYLVRFIFLAGIYFVVSGFDKRTKQSFLFWLAVTGVLIAILGLFQYFLYPDLRNLRYAGWDEHLYRVFSTFLDPNFAGAFFVLVFLLLIGSLSSRRAQKLSLVGIALTLVALLLTYSRSAYLMFFISLGLLLLLLKKKAWLAVFFLLFILGLFLLPKNLPSEGVNLIRTASILARQESMQKALVIFKDNPLLGVGFNSYRYAQMRYGFLENKMVHSGAGTDNSFLFVLATMGILGFIAFVYLWFRILQLAFMSQEFLISKIVIASIFGLFVSSFFINSLFYESILVWIWVLVGIMGRK